MFTLGRFIGIQRSSNQVRQVAAFHIPTTNLIFMLSGRVVAVLQPCENNCLKSKVNTYIIRFNSKSKIQMCLKNQKKIGNILNLGLVFICPASESKIWISKYSRFRNKKLNKLYTLATERIRNIKLILIMPQILVFDLAIENNLARMMTYHTSLMSNLTR